MNELPNRLEIDEFADVIYGDGRVMSSIAAFGDLDVMRAMVARYNAHAAREQALADVAGLATQLARSLTNYNEAFALVRQIRAILKQARA